MALRAATLVSRLTGSSSTASLPLYQENCRCCLTTAHTDLGYCGAAARFSTTLPTINLPARLSPRAAWWMAASRQRTSAGGKSITIRSLGLHWVVIRGEAGDRRAAREWPGFQGAVADGPV